MCVIGYREDVLWGFAAFSFCMLREEKWLLHLEIAEHIVYLLFLVVILSFALRLRKCKHNNSNSGGQTPASVSIAGNDDVGVPNINIQLA